MYTLLSGFYKYLTQKDEYCILILGLDNAGKTVGFLRGTSLRRLWNRPGVTNSCWLTDLPGGGQDQIHKELPWHEPEQDNHHSRAEHWPD